MISDEQILEELLNPKKLLIIGKTGSGKTRLINRILKHIENQPDTIYLFITHDLVNHTGENSYGHINAERFKIDWLADNPALSIGLAVLFRNTAIEFPSCDLPMNHAKHHVLKTVLRLLFDASHSQKKRLILITDDVSDAVNEVIYALSNDDKCIITATNIKNIIDKFQKLEPEGILSIQRFNQLHLD